MVAFFPDDDDDDDVVLGPRRSSVRVDNAGYHYLPVHFKETSTDKNSTGCISPIPTSSIVATTSYPVVVDGTTAVQFFAVFGTLILFVICSSNVMLWKNIVYRMCPGNFDIR